MRLTESSNISTGMSFDAFSKDRKTIDAVVRNLEIIGEAANRLPEDFKKAIRI